jgi:hypothetical protein
MRLGVRVGMGVGLDGVNKDATPAHMLEPI